MNGRLTRTRAATGTALLCLVVLGLPGSASAAPTGRLSGAYAGTRAVMSSTAGAPIGFSSYANYVLRPNCPHGICATRLSYRAGVPVQLTVRPTGSGYLGSGTYSAPCEDDGHTLEPHAYVTTEKYVLNVSEVVHGTAISFSGTDELTQVLTPAGRAAGCPSGGVTTYAVQATRG